MSSSDRLIGVRAKIERANQHIADLDHRLRVFYDSRPYEVRTNRDPQTRRWAYYVASVKDTPTLITLVAGDAIQNLRSAMDFLAWQLVEANGNTPTRQTMYPIFKGAAEYKAGYQTKVQGMSIAAVNLIDATKPYKGGNDDLWKLHELNNIDKHRLMLTVGSAYQSINLGAHGCRRIQAIVGDSHVVPVLDVFYRIGDRMCPLKVGYELFVDAPDAEEDKNMEFRFEVALAEPQVAGGEPLLETLHQLAHLVDGIVTQFVPLL